MKRIGIDARLIDETGVGRYIRNLIKELGVVDTENEYVVFLRKKSFDAFLLPNERWQKRLADVRWHSFTEQLLMPVLFFREKLDLVHIPYFNVPIFYPGTLVVTIHDLTILHFDTGKASTLPLPFYKLRRLGYYLILSVGLIRAAHIIAVSKATKQEIVDHFSILPDKITVTHEGIDERFVANSLQVKKEKKIINDQYFLYVGNAYPHKNLEMMLVAFKQFLFLKKSQNVKLVLVGRDDYFYTRLKKYAKNLDIFDNLVFWGEASDLQLISLYKHAIALIFPSLMEGFGLPGLEALYLGCPVIASDISVFHEILGPNALYFNPSDVDQLTKYLTEISNRQTIKNRKPQFSLPTYTWRRMAEITCGIYQNI